MYCTKLEEDFINENRNNEINRFWSRGSYFWVFIAALYTAYFSFFNTFYSKVYEIEIKPALLINIPLYVRIILVMLSFLGFFFCASWYLVNKGSKYWQVNWEKELGNTLHYGYIYGNYKNNMIDEDINAINPIKPYCFSVSKITLAGSFLLSLFSMFFFSANLLLIMPFLNCISFKKLIIILCVLIIVVFMLTFVICSSFVGNLNEKYVWIPRFINILIWILILIFAIKLILNIDI